MPYCRDASTCGDSELSSNLHFPKLVIENDYETERSTSNLGDLGGEMEKSCSD